MGTVERSKVKKARKVYCCVACRTKIDVGDRYYSYAPGMYRRETYCLECAATANLPNATEIAS